MKWQNDISLLLRLALRDIILSISVLPADPETLFCVHWLILLISSKCSVMELVMISANFMCLQKDWSDKIIFFYYFFYCLYWLKCVFEQQWKMMFGSHIQSCEIISNKLYFFLLYISFTVSITKGDTVYQLTPKNAIL